MRRVAAACLLLSLVACGGNDSDGGGKTPEPGPKPSGAEKVVETLMRALEDGDCDTVKDVVVTPSAIDCAQLGEAAGMLAFEGVKLDDVRYKLGKVAGDSAVVTITWSKDLPPEPIDVQRVDGEWRVVFDSAV